VVRPGPIVDVVGADALRYFLLREITFGQDGSFSYDALIQRYNADLANGLGNLASRTLTMIHQYRKGHIPDSPGSPEIAETARRTTEVAIDAFCDFNFSRGLETLWSFISVIDKFIVERAPWKLVKDDGGFAQQQLDEVLYSSAEALRILCAWIYPVMPNSARNIWIQLGMSKPIESATFADFHWGKLEAGQKIGSIAAVFPRLDASAIAKMETLEVQEKARQAELFGVTKPAAGPPPAAVPPEGVAKISIDDFVKIDLRVGQVVSAERVKGADKLLHMKVDIGEAEPRTIVAGIAEAYAPEVMVGRKVVIVANLQPRKLRGIESNGMIVAASLEGGKPVLAGFLEDVPIGARLK
jgi:methionyl-tRNA synthetase